MFLVDTHCHIDHLDLDPYAGDLMVALRQANEAGIGHLLCVCITLKDFPKMLELAKQHPFISASVGLHPNEPIDESEPSALDLVSLAQDEKIIAIGETGLDYFRSTGDLAWQRERFRQHIRAACQIRKPLIVHTREAKADTIQILREEGAEVASGIMHCFTEDWEMAKEALDLGFYISISGIVTFKSALQIQEVAKRVPIERLLIETDSPYLAPVPHRGKSNEPAFVAYVAKAIAELRGISLQSLAENTTENFYRLFPTANRFLGSWF